MASSLAVELALWSLDQFGLLPAPDPWLATDAVLGITDWLWAAQAIIAAVCLGVIYLRYRLPGRSRGRRVMAWLGCALSSLVILVGAAVTVATAGDGFDGNGLPGNVASPVNLPPAQRSTVEYCRPDGVPLAMDVYTPGKQTNRLAPVALYVHGGGFMLGNRKDHGLGATLANSAGALFSPLQHRLNANGYLVASIDYRLAPAAPWPAQIVDAKCAVRFLKAHAADLRIDPNRIAVWGSSAGGTLVSLLGTTTPTAGFDVGQYLDQSSSVRAVVDMFGPQT